MEQGQSLLLCERCRSHWLLDSLSSNDTDLTDDYQLPELSEEEMVMKLEQHKADIALLRRKLKKLESAKRTLEARIHWRRHGVSALRNLPVEIWEKIFALACSFSSNDGYSLEIMYSNSSKHTPPDPVFPIVLSHVSSLWRAIALGFPRLWLSISIRFSGDIQPLGAKKLLESFLENSAECPLDLRVVVASEIATWRKHALSSWDLLKCHYTRSEKLVIENYSNFNRSAFDPFQGVASTEFGIFHHLLSFSYVEQSPPKSELNGSWQASPIAPRLAQVQVYNLYPSSYLPYFQLTKLIVDSVKDVDTLLHTLKVSKNLQFLQLSNLSDTQSSQVIPHHVELPFLHTFSIWYVSKQRQFVIMDNANLQALFSSLVMPVLSTFKLACRTSPVSGKFYWPSSLLTILRQSSATL
ncbi:hypothetical protein L218DRAFT_678601 [Marasmius fiardii PR-910]|nr:hypothetical protein L218DRAFT_678601 [Marasmius fiardii PR-910]